MASDDDAPRRSVAHTEGTSYIVAFGHPELFPMPGSRDLVFSPFTAAGGQNPYQPESGVLHAIYTEIQEVGQSWTTIHSVPPPFLCRFSTYVLHHLYEALRGLSERSRGLRLEELIGHMRPLATDQYAVAILRSIGGEDQENRGTLIVAIAVAALIRGCHEDKTLTAFSATLDPPPAIFDANWTRKIYFNLSDRERKRLRRFDNGIRRMPYVLMRQLILRKAPKKGAHGPARRLVRRSFMPDSEELFRVVVSFL